LFIQLFSIVFTLVLIVSVLLTYSMPESYASRARVEVEKDPAENQGLGGTVSADSYDPYFIQTTFEIMQSQLILSNVIATLNLNETWGRKYSNDETLKTTESLEILKQRIQFAPVKNTKLISITVYGDEKREAADIANAIAKSYVDYRYVSLREKQNASLKGLQTAYWRQDDEIRQLKAELARSVPTPGSTNDAHTSSSSQEADGAKQWNLDQLLEAHKMLFAKIEAAKVDMETPKFLVQIIDIAQPALAPIMPNKPANIFSGAVVGCCLGTFVSGTVVILVRRSRKKLAESRVDLE